MRNVDLTFSDFLERFPRLGKDEWITVYLNHTDDAEHAVFFSALISDEIIAMALSHRSWDLMIGYGLPGWSFHYEDGKEIANYSRHSTEGIEPLVMRRSFHGMKDEYWEVLEEFRYYFNLYHDKRNNKFIRINDNGDDEDVILISENEIKIKLRLIKEFLSAKKMHLALFFSIDRFSERTLDELRLKEHREDKKGDDFIYSIGVHPWEHFSDDRIESHGFLIGKKLIPGLKDFKPKLLGREDEGYAEFIIGLDENGKEIFHTCEEDKLANLFGKNRGAPQFITPVFFKKDVLTKYYSQPEKYSVEDGYLRCGGMWGLRMDNNHPDHVMAYLGDLGHLSHNEQLHWRSFNVPSGKMSYTAWARGIKGEFADPESSDLFFKQKLSVFQEQWEKQFGWKLFKPLSKGDEHYFKSLRRPLTNEQKEFDEQVLALAKVFIDSLNEEELLKGIEINKKDAKGLDKLESFLLSKDIRVDGMLEFLRKLQALRSTSVAHRKGVNYEKVKKFFSIGEKDLSSVFDEILINCIRVLNTLELHFLKT